VKHPHPNRARNASPTKTNANGTASKPPSTPPESRLAAATAAAHDPTIAADAALLQQRFTEVTAAQAEVDRLYGRWAELEGKVAE